MAEVTKNGTPSYSSVVPQQPDTLVGLLAGEAIASGDACYVNTSGVVMRSSGAAANAAAFVDGFAFTAASAGDPITLVDNGNFRYGSALTPSTRYYLSGTVAGGLADAASTGGVLPVAFALDAERVRIIKGSMGRRT